VHVFAIGAHHVIAALGGVQAADGDRFLAGIKVLKSANVPLHVLFRRGLLKLGSQRRVLAAL